MKRTTNKLFKAIRDGGINRERYWYVMDYARDLFTEGERALDVGSGDGVFAVGFSLIGYHVTALDPRAEPSLTNLYTHKVTTLTEWLLLRGPDESRFDLVHLGQILEHVERPEEMMAQACSVCSGRVIVSVPDFMLPNGGHLRSYTWSAFQEFVQRFITAEEWHQIPTAEKPGRHQWICMGWPK